jgi:hypothetical protein
VKPPVASSLRFFYRCGDCACAGAGAALVSYMPLAAVLDEPWKRRDLSGL